MNKNLFVTSMYKFTTILVDLIILFTSIYVSFAIKFNFVLPEFNFKPFIDVSPFIAVAYLIFMYVYGLNDTLKQSIGEIIYSTFLTILALMICTMAISFFFRGFSYPRSVIIISSIFQFVIISLWRSFTWKIKRNLHGKKSTLIIGDENAIHVAKKIIHKHREIYRLEYICGSNCDYIEQYIKQVEVVFLCEDVDATKRNNIVDLCLYEMKSLFIIPRIYDVALLNSKLNIIDDVPVLKINALGLTIEQRIIKRLMDIIISLLAIVIFSPLMIFISILIKLEDRGTVFYYQERITEGERRFNVIKFRTMIVNAEKLTGPKIASASDERITKIGKSLRATRLDELPQVFNIIKGEMSVVGPRPERPYFVEIFKNEIPDYKYRDLVKSGLTGLSQVLGKYNTTAKDKVRYDLLYIRNYSLLLDIKLILQTVKILFLKESTEGFKDDVSLSEILKRYNLEITIDKD